MRTPKYYVDHMYRLREAVPLGILPIEVTMVALFCFAIGDATLPGIGVGAGLLYILVITSVKETR